MRSTTNWRKCDGCLDCYYVADVLHSESSFRKKPTLNSTAANVGSGRPAHSRILVIKCFSSQDRGRDLGVIHALSAIDLVGRPPNGSSSTIPSSNTITIVGLESQSRESSKRSSSLVKRRIHADLAPLSSQIRLPAKPPYREGKPTSRPVKGSKAPTMSRSRRYRSERRVV